MKRGYGYILYLLLGLVILGGLGLLAFRLPAAGFLSEASGLNAATGIKVVAKTEVLNTEIFQSPSFTALKNNVINFNFDRICSQPVALPPAVAVGSPLESDTATTVETAKGCVLGSGLPFASPAPKNN